MLPAHNILQAQHIISSEAAFGGRDNIGAARINFHRHTQCATKGLEHGFCLMVGIVSTQIINMQCHQSVVYKTLEKLEKQIHIKTTNRSSREGHVILKPGSTGEVDHNTR